MANKMPTQAGGPSELCRSVVGNKYIQSLTNKQASLNSLRGRGHSSHLTVGRTAWQVVVGVIGQSSWSPPPLGNGMDGFCRGLSCVTLLQLVSGTH